MKILRRGKKKEGKQMRRWIVTHYVCEYFEVIASSRQEAIDNTEDPYSAIIKRETAVLSEDQKGFESKVSSPLAHG
jgi:hypothetical protein